MSTKITKSCAGPNIRKEYHFRAKVDPIYVKLHFYFLRRLGPPTGPRYYFSKAVVS